MHRLRKKNNFLQVFFADALVLTYALYRGHANLLFKPTTSDGTSPVLDGSTKAGWDLGWLGHVGYNLRMATIASCGLISIVSHVLDYLQRRMWRQLTGAGGLRVSATRMLRIFLFVSYVVGRRLAVIFAVALLKLTIQYKSCANIASETDSTYVCKCVFSCVRECMRASVCVAFTKFRE